MDINKPMPLLLIEDDVAECTAYKNCAAGRDDIRFVGMTSSSYEGLNYVKNHLPEGVILDLELHKGSGSGLEFLSSLQETKLDLRPLIIVVTNVSSNVIYNHAHSIGADLVFYKRQNDYSAEMVINSMVSLRKALHEAHRSGANKELLNLETPDERKMRISDRINAEFDLIGISAHLKGRKYLFDAINLQLNKEDQNDAHDPIVNQLTNIYKRANSSISRAMQTAINHAWRTSNIEDLQVHYTARVNYKTGVPTPTEFIYFYVDKLKKYL